MRPIAVGGGNFWHWGGWTYTLPRAHDGSLKSSYSTFAVLSGTIDVNIVVSRPSPRSRQTAARTNSTPP